MTAKRFILGCFLIAALLATLLVVYFSGITPGSSRGENKGWSLKEPPAGSKISMQVDYSMSGYRARTQLACSSQGLLKSSGTTLSKARRTCALLSSNDRIRRLLLSAAPVCPGSSERSLRIRFQGKLYSRQIARSFVASGCTDQTLDFQAAGPLLQSLSPPTPWRDSLLKSKKKP